MRRLLICSIMLLVFLWISIHAEAQSDFRGKWSAGIVFSPDYAYRLISFPDSLKGWEKLLDEHENPVFGYTTGLSFLYSINNKLELESGLFYSAKGFGFRMPGEEGWQVPEGNPAGEWHLNDPHIPKEAITRYNYRYLDVPFKVNWFFHESRVRLFLSAGIAGSFFLEAFSKQKLIFPDRTEKIRNDEQDVDFHPVVLSLSGGAGIEYPLSDRLSIRINPEFRHGITPVADTSLKLMTWSAGINTGIFVELKKGGTSSHP